MIIDKTIKNKVKEIKLLILDVDGVLTDGSLYFDENGSELKCFNSLDGHGIKMLIESEIEVAIISARANKVVKYRADNLGITHCYLGADDKLSVFKALLQELKLEVQQVAYIGDDVIDLPVMTKIGLPIAVNNAVDDVKRYADYTTFKNGGNGAVREVCDMILKLQNKYQGILDKYN